MVRLHSDGVWYGILQKLNVRYTRMKQDVLWMMGRSNAQFFFYYDRPLCCRFYEFDVPLLMSEAQDLKP